MRFIIYGAGGIGGVIGGHLARTGHDVVLIGRPGHMNAINKNGLSFVTPSGTLNLKIPAFTEPKQVKFTPDDIICLTLKGQNTEEALQVLKKATDRLLPIFCFQNGVRNEETAVRYYPNKVYGVMVRVGAEYLKDGEVIARRDPPGWFVIGHYPIGTDRLAENVAEALREAGFIVKTSEDVMPYKWGKLMANLNNAIGAITDERGEGPTEISRLVQKELSDLLADAKIPWISQDKMLKEMPDTKVKGSVESTGGSSTWQSLTREQGSVETEFLNGEVVRLAKRLGRHAPANEMLIRVTMDMAAKHEKPGKYTSAQLLSMVGKTV
jgi:2-dehydropantoate 2-reductase